MSLWNLIWWLLFSNLGTLTQPCTLSHALRRGGWYYIICYLSWGTLEVDTGWKDAETIDVSLDLKTHLPFKAAVISPVDNYSTLLEVLPLPGAKEYNA